MFGKFLQSNKMESGNRGISAYTAPTLSVLLKHSVLSTFKRTV